MESLPKIDETPREVPWTEIDDFANLDERVGVVTVLFGNMFGVNDGYVEWCPDDIPPTEQEQERLAWLWLCWPCLFDELRLGAKRDLLEVMTEYNAGRMEEWWNRKAANEPAGDPWPCPNCSEQIEAQFLSCWNCQTQRPEDDD